MRSKLSLCGLLFASLTTLSAAQATYFFDYTVDTIDEGVGPISASGSITIDTLGPVANANVIDWLITVSSGSRPDTILTPLNSNPSFNGAVTATATDLEILLSDPMDGNGDEAQIAFFDSTPDDLLRVQLGTGEGSPNLLSIENSPNFSVDGIRDRGVLDVGGPGVFSFAQIPEPATLALLGVGGAALLRRRRA